MKHYEKEPFESLTEEQLSELLKMTKHPMTDVNLDNIKNKVNQKISGTEMKTKKITKINKKRKWAYIVGVAATLMLMVGFTQRSAIREAYMRAFGTESEKLLLNADKLDISVEDQGLKLTAKNSFKDGDTTYVMMTLQDLTGDRLSKDTRIDSWEMLSGGNTRVIDYDETTKTAVLLTSAVSWEGDQNHGFLLDRFKSHQKDFGSTTNIEWDKVIQQQPNWEDLTKETSSGGGAREEELNRLGLIFEELAKETLETKVLNTKLNQEEEIYLENAAYKDGLLHLLVKQPNDFNHDFLDVELAAKNSEKKISSVASIQAGKGTHNNKTGRSDYDEYIFDIPESELENYDLKVLGSKSETIVEGKWAIQLQQPTELAKEKLADISLTNGTELTNIELSGLSLSLDYQIKGNENSPLSISLIKKDGSEKELLETSDKDNLVAITDSDQLTINFDYVPLDEISQLKINEQVIDVNK